MGADERILWMLSGALIVITMLVLVTSAVVFWDMYRQGTWWRDMERIQRKAEREWEDSDG